MRFVRKIYNNVFGGVIPYVDKFDVHDKKSFPNYLERLEFYFMANDTLREEIFAGINFRKFFFRTFRGN